MSRAPRWRRVLATVLIVLGCLLVPISVLGVWVNNTLLDTDQYVDTVGPLAEKPGVQEAVSKAVARQVRSGVNLDKKIQDALSSRAQFLAEPLADAVERVVQGAALEVVQSDQFETIWEHANRRAHTRVVALLKGEGTETVATKNGKVVIDLDPVIERVRTRLENRGLDVFGDAKPKHREFVLFDSEGLRSVQGIVDLLDTLGLVLPIVTVLIVAAGIALARDRRRALVRAALGVALAAGLVLTAFNLARTAYLDALSDASLTGGKAAGEIYDQILSFLRLSLRTIFVLGLVVALGAWLAGPGRVATRIRTWFRDVGRGAAGEGEPSAVATLVATYRSGLRVAVVGVGLLLLVALTAPGPIAVFVIALLVVAGLVAIEVLARGAPAVARQEQS